MRSNILICARDNLLFIKIADADAAMLCEDGLSVYARKKLNLCRNEKRRCEIMLGDTVRRAALSAAAAENEKIAVRDDGKTYLPDRRDIGFNVSHSGNLAVCAVLTDGAGEVGVDIELIDRSRGADRIKRLSERTFTDKEREKVNASDDPAAEFYAVWTKKEAYLKYTGEGITRPLVSVDTESESLGCRFYGFTVSDVRGTEYALAVCISASCADVIPKIEQI